MQEQPRVCDWTLEGFLTLTTTGKTRRREMAHLAWH